MFILLNIDSLCRRSMTDNLMTASNFRKKEREEYIFESAFDYLFEFIFVLESLISPFPILVSNSIETRFAKVTNEICQILHFSIFFGEIEKKKRRSNLTFAEKRIPFSRLAI